MTGLKSDKETLEKELQQLKAKLHTATTCYAQAEGEVLKLRNVTKKLEQDLATASRPMKDVVSEVRTKQLQEELEKTKKELATVNKLLSLEQSNHANTTAELNRANAEHERTLKNYMDDILIYLYIYNYTFQCYFLT